MLSYITLRRFCNENSLFLNLAVPEFQKINLQEVFVSTTRGCCSSFGFENRIQPSFKIVFISRFTSFFICENILMFGNLRIMFYVK